jgi:hypothetical protein
MTTNDSTSGQIIKTARTNDAQFKIVDGAAGTASTKFLNVVNDGDTVTAGTNDAGNPSMFKGIDNKHHEGLCDSLGHLLVATVPAAGSAVVEDYLAFTAATTLAGVVGSTYSPQTHDKAITVSKNAMNITASVAATGLVKWDLGTYNGTAFTILKTWITSPAHPSDKITLNASPTAPGTGTLSVHLVATNLDTLSCDGYSTLEWTEM